MSVPPTVTHRSCSSWGHFHSAQSHLLSWGRAPRSLAPLLNEAEHRAKEVGSPAARLLCGKANVYKTCSSADSPLLSSGGRCASLPGAGAGAARGAELCRPAAAGQRSVCPGGTGAPAPQSEHVGAAEWRIPSGPQVTGCHRVWCLPGVRAHAVWHCPACSPVGGSVSPGLLGWTPRTDEHAQLAFLLGKS